MFFCFWNIIIYLSQCLEQKLEGIFKVNRGESFHLIIMNMSLLMMQNINEAIQMHVPDKQELSQSPQTQSHRIK
jgi:hypothetical protein